MASEIQQHSTDVFLSRSKTGIWRVWIVSLLAVLALASPFVVTWYSLGMESVYAAFKNDTNPRAEYWGSVREGMKGYTAVEGQETNVLIENGGQIWRELRNGPVLTYGAWLIGLVVVALAAFHTIIGKAKLEQRTGNKVLRWTGFERALHWYVAILFIILAITGLSIMYGRAVLIPVMGLQGFSGYAEFSKLAHDYLSLLFVLGLVVMLLLWLKENFFTKQDWEWFKAGGGYLSKGEHPHAHKVNAGEKVWFWILFIAGIALMISGIILLLPNLGTERETMQSANIVHGISSLLLSAFVLGHIYLGTIGNEGSFEGMVKGEVDEAWAKQHHDLWYDEVKGKNPG